MSVVYSQEMDSNIGHPQHNLLRYRSAPSLLLTSLMDNNNSSNNIGCVNNDEAFKSSEMETILEKFISSNNGFNSSEPLEGFGGKLVKQEDFVSQHNGYSSYGSSSDQMVYQSQQIQGLQNGSLGASGNAFDGSFDAVSSMALENSSQTKMGQSNSNNLIRQKSSPAGFFSNFSVDNGFRACDVSNGQGATTSTSRLHCTLNFSSRPSSGSNRMPQIAENGNEGLESNCVQNRNLGNENGFTSGFWNGSVYKASKTSTNRGEIMFSTSNALDTQGEEFGYRKLGLSHHLSLPSSFTKVGSMDKFYQIQGSAPCKIRAKRGFATHPRSIAERERRTRISARIKKLQDLFPKSDKQTSTADMLDLAAEYIKDLQNQVKILTDTKAKCTCTSTRKQYS